MKMAYIPLPNGAEGYGNGNDLACLIWQYEDGDYGFDCRYSEGVFSIDIDNFKF